MPLDLGSLKKAVAAHTYEPRVAERVYDGARGFARDARRLLEALEARNA